MPRRGVVSLKLRAFRSYQHYSLEVEPTSVILIGSNGIGKTSLLEAISFLTPGRGLRRARLSEIQCDEYPQEPWAVAASLETPDGVLNVGTGRESVDSERRIVQVNGVRLKTQTALSHYLHVTWLTPQMDRLFVEGAKERRRFLDRLVFGFDSLHAQRVLRYEQALRERHRLFDLLDPDPLWFQAIENILSSEGVAITVARRHVIQRLNQVFEKRVTAFPQGRLVLEGTLETQLDQDKTALQVQEEFSAFLREHRLKHKVSGTTPQGCHRSDLKVFHHNGREAAFCSTGEQKALLISLILAAGYLQMQHRETLPLLLLDEIAAHLDHQRRCALFEELLSLRMQIWMAGTEAHLFSEIADKVQIVSLG